VQSAEGALNEVSNNLTRMRELAIQSANGTLSTADRIVIQTEFSELVVEIGRIASTTQFNGISLLDANDVIEFQVGISQGETISVTLQDTSSIGLGIDTLAVHTVSNATGSLSEIDDAINSVTRIRGSLGAVQNRMMSAIRSIFNGREQLAAAESRIRDVDVAEETADLTRNTIMQQASVSVLSQANLQPQIALALLQG
jgi:flagellin